MGVEQPLADILFEVLTPLGFLVRSNLSLNNCTVIENEHVGIFNNDSMLTLNNSTVSDNQERGIRNNHGLTLNNSTITKNISEERGAGIYNEELYGTAILSNTIVAGNSALASPDCAGPINSGGYNLIGNTSGCTFNAARSSPAWPKSKTFAGYVKF